MKSNDKDTNDSRLVLLPHILQSQHVIQQVNDTNLAQFSSQTTSKFKGLCKIKSLHLQRGEILTISYSNRAWTQIQERIVSQ